MPTRLALTDLPERNLDALRAIAVLAVLVCHIVQSIVGTRVAWSLVGRAGVLLFFVHTSLVLMASLERMAVREELAGWRWVVTFYWRRAARIYPLAWATIALCLVCAIPYTTIPGEPVPIAAAHAPVTVLANVLLVQNLLNLPNVLGVLWTLPLELQMYVLLPACYLAARRGRGTMLAAFLSAIAFGVLVLWVPIPGLWRLTVGWFAPCFLSGVLAYWLLRQRSSQHRAFAWPLPILGLVALFVAVVPAITGSAEPIAAADWLFCLVVALLIPRACELRLGVFTRAAHEVAQYSYGIYLLHLPAWTFAFDRMGSAPAWTKWTAYVALLVGLPIVAYHGLEAPAIRWARHRGPGATSATSGT